MPGERDPLSPLPPLLVVFLGRVLAEGDVEGRVLRMPPLPAEDVPPEGRVVGLALAPAPPRPELPEYPRAWSFVTRLVPDLAPYFCAVCGFL